MDKISIKSKLKSLLPYAALPLLLVTLFVLLTVTTSMPNRAVYGENGVWDLRDFDFENYNARLTGDVAYIPNALLTPEEFAARSGEAIIGNTANINFLTSRVLILVPNDMWYSFTRDSILHSHRQYVNGLWIEEAQRGSPGHNRQSEIAGEGRITFTARPVMVADEGSTDAYYVIELVQQSSSHVHSRNDHHMGWLIGEGTRLIDQSRAMDFQRGITMGFFFLLFLLFLMVYFMLQRNRAALYFSLFCLMWLLRMGTTGVWAFSVLMPWMDWAVKFRINYIAIPAAAILSLAIIDVLFPKTLHKVILRINYIFAAAFIALYLFADTVFMSNALLVSYVIFGLTILYILVRFILKVRNTQFGQKVFIIGMVFFLFATVSDFFHFSFDFAIMPFEMTGIGMLIFALCMAGAIFIATMREIEGVKIKERELAAEKSALERVNHLKTELMRTVSHEMRTPLAVMMGYAQLSAEDVRRKGMGEDTADNLDTIADEARRLNILLEELSSPIYIKEFSKDRREISADAVIRKVAGLYEVVLERKNIALRLNLPKDLPTIYGNNYELTQIMFNLLRNADKHTDRGAITISAQAADDEVTITVTDTGAGISPELLPQVFEHGISGEKGGMGFGLAICREIVQAHGKRIWIDSPVAGPSSERSERPGELGKGTTVSFTMPIYNAEKQKEDNHVG